VNEEASEERQESKEIIFIILGALASFAVLVFNGLKSIVSSVAEWF